MTVSIPTLADSAMLAYLRVSIWSARKLDKRTTAKVTEDAGATTDAARVSKHLLANADSLLKDVQRKASELREYLDSNTLPWNDAGQRILSNDKALTFVGPFENKKKEFDALLDKFVEAYPALREQALSNLGDMANNDDYPPADVVRSKFAVKLSFDPLPLGFGDIRTGMSEAQAKAWQNHFEGNVKTQINEALANAWNRLREDLLRYSDRLKIKEGTDKCEIFRDTMVHNLRDTCTLLASLNVFGDANLQRITEKVSREIAMIEPDMLRTMPSAAKHVKSEVDALLASMQDLMG
jgi:hypothetical protein